MRLVREHINEKFTEQSDPIKDLDIGAIREIKQRYWRIPDEAIDRILKGKHEILFYRNTYALVYYDRRTKCWRAVTDIYPKDSGSYLNSYDDDKKGVIKRVKLGIGKKLNTLKIKGKLHEKFTEKSDPVHDMGIGRVPYHYNNLYVAKRDIEYVADHKKVKVPKGTIIIAQGGGYYGTYKGDISLGNIFEINGKLSYGYDIRKDKDNYTEIYYDLWEKTIDLVKEVEDWIRDNPGVEAAAKTGDIENVYKAIEHQYDVVEKIKKLIK